jgi:hypothetical protein
MEIDAIQYIEKVFVRGMRIPKKTLFNRNGNLKISVVKF